MCYLSFIYRKRGRIHWAKLSWIPLDKVFIGKLLQCLTFKTLKQRHYIQSLNKYSRKNFCGTLENCKKSESLAGNQ